ncbi:MAG TPA: FecR domain-containing protein [Bacteroidales bacterium]|nr:FecR domain-containing protein [Bacteroidales bacterium]HUX95705.1 FecR domain-containing protein [Bacteroidales bacterium]
MNIELLEKYCKNACTEEELSSVLVWFETSARTSEGKSILYKIWEEIPDEDVNDKINFNQLLGRIHHEINLTQTKNLLEEADQDLIRHKRRKKLIQIFTRAAAILLFPVLGFGLYMSAKYQSAREGQISVSQAYNEVFSSVDAITKVTLPDGSSIWLNHSSSLKYPAMFQGDSRGVELSGEGYFEVFHNPDKPFIVTAGAIDIKALGTTFNVMAYPDEDKIETSLINGCVELKRTGLNGRSSTVLKMKPTDLAIFQKNNNKFLVRTISDDRYFSWKEGKLVFNKEPISEVAKKLSRWFNIEIQIRDTKLLELTYTGTFVDETLPQVMELIAMVSPVSYTISGRKEISSGTFSKRVVIINYKNK